MSFRDELFHHFDERGKTYYGDLLKPHQHALASAYILENPDIIPDLIANVRPIDLAEHFADLHHSVESCDVFQMADVLRIGMVGSKDLESLIDGEMDNFWSSYQIERKVEQTAA